MPKERGPLPNGWHWKTSWRQAKGMAGMDPVQYTHPEREDGAWVWEDWDDYYRNPDYNPNSKAWWIYPPGQDYPDTYRRQRDRQSRPRCFKTMGSAMKALDREFPLTKP